MTGLLVAAGFAVFWFAGNEIIELVLGPEYISTQNLIPWFFVAALLVCPNLLLAQALISRNREWRYMLSAALMVPFNLGLNIWLIHVQGTAGVVLAMVITELALGALMLRQLLRIDGGSTSVFAAARSASEVVWRMPPGALAAAPSDKRIARHCPARRRCCARGRELHSTDGRRKGNSPYRRLVVVGKCAAREPSERNIPGGSAGAAAPRQPGGERGYVRHHGPAAAPSSNWKLNRGGQASRSFSTRSSMGSVSAVPTILASCKFAIATLDPAKPADVGVRLEYEKPIVIRPGERAAADISERTIAFAEPSGSTGALVWRRVMDLSGIEWRNRSPLYPFRRMLRIPGPSYAAVSAHPRGSVVQVISNLPLGGAGMLALEVAPCAAISRVNLRFRTRFGSALLTNLVGRSTSGTSDQSHLAVFSLEAARQELGLSPDDADLELYEAIAFLDKSPGTMLDCHPLRSIQVSSFASDVALDTPTLFVSVPTTLEKQADGSNLIRINQGILTHHDNWGHVLRRIVLTLSGKGSETDKVGIEIRSMSQTTPGRSGAARDPVHFPPAGAVISVDETKLVIDRKVAPTSPEWIPIGQFTAASDRRAVVRRTQGVDIDVRALRLTPTTDTGAP
ncbi:MAG: polysaccharide biosynthesis C-terminal domain-containing protein [Hyphomicrobium sp.]